jgi:hypothetical protein
VAVPTVFPIAPAGGGAVDRLDRFRELAATRLGPDQIVDSERDHAAGSSGATYRDIYALLDDEIVESLASGDLFASPAFLQDRLDAFTEAWGGAFLSIARLDRVIVGAFTLGEASTDNSIRAYGRLHGDAALLTTMHREGRPTLHRLPRGPNGRAQLLVAWDGRPTGRGTRPLRLDLLREGGDGVEIGWSTADVFPDGLIARTYAIRGAEIRVRYELRYDGWTPGCEPQTEAEDVYRLAPGTSTFARASRREHHGWHRELRLTVSRFFAALAAGDRAHLAALVPDAKLRDRLPPTLRAESACDAPDAVPPGAVSVAAVTAEHRPWALTFGRAGGGWGLRTAAPVLQ